MKYALFFAGLVLTTACNPTNTKESDRSDEGTTVPAASDSIAVNPSPNEQHNMHGDSSPSTIDSAKLHH